MAVNTDPDAIYYREPSKPKYQIVFPWGTGGNMIRHLVGLHPDQELLDQAGCRLSTTEDKFENLMSYQYPMSRQAEHWLGQEWETRHLYNESRIEHWPPASRFGLPSIFIEPDMPRISIRLYQLKNPSMNGWDLKFGIKMNKLFANEQMAEYYPKHRRAMVIKFSELLQPMTIETYNKMCLLLDLASEPCIYDMCIAVHQRWIDIQNSIWLKKYQMSLDQWADRERRHHTMLDNYDTIL